MNPYDIAWSLSKTLGTLAAGIAVLKLCLAGSRFFDRAAGGIGSVSERIAKSMESQEQSQALLVQSGQRSAESSERLAKSAEINSQILPTLQRWEEDRRDQSMTMRVISRQLREIKERLAIEGEDLGESEK
jgi:hypothetical protein